MPNDEVTPSDARDFVMARAGAAVAAATAARDRLIDFLAAVADGDTEFDRAEALDEADAFLGEASRGVQLAQDLIEHVDPAEMEPEPSDDDEPQEEN